MSSFSLLPKTAFKDHPIPQCLLALDFLVDQRGTQMFLVWISDVHCGPTFSEEAFQTIVEEINDLVSYVVIPDLTKIMVKYVTDRTYG